MDEKTITITITDKEQAILELALELVDTIQRNTEHVYFKNYDSFDIDDVYHLAEKLGVEVY